jgi:NAD(P)-dependent dehydrogenase (short-subunit alcohol dehydrogenase family)
MSTWLITGCSTGLGRALAEAVIAAGHSLCTRPIGAARRATAGCCCAWRNG